MRRPRFRLSYGFLLALIVTAGTVVAGEATERMRAGIYRMTDFFDTQLPGTLQEHNITLHFTPKFSDFRDQEYVRYPLELRYGLNDRLELVTGINPFGPNPFKMGRDHRWGPGETKLGVRYDWGPSLHFFDATTLGLETRVPIGKPPIELNDHYTHVKPTIAAARTLLQWPDVTFYTNVSYDRSVVLTPRGAPPPGVMRKNTIEVWPGYLFKPNEFAYFTEYRFSHIAEATDNHLAHELRFGSIWDVPLERTAGWKLPGKWQLELGYKVRHEEGLSMEQGVNLRVNWRTSFREVFGPAQPAATAPR